MKVSNCPTGNDREFLSDVCAGLSQAHKSLPCKYLYDQRGSRLFDQICETQEYYPTRTELEIMRTNSAQIAHQLDRQVMLVEYGSGSSLKTRGLLDSLESPAAYVPVDISEEHLLSTAESLRSEFPEIEIAPVVADFTKPFPLPSVQTDPTHIALYFPGSTIGNCTYAQAGQLLRNMSQMVGAGGGLLIGIDLQKDPQILEAAYNDAAGVTAQFNLNLLARINAELDGDFDLSQFEHRAIYNSVQHRIEISLVSQCAQQAKVDGYVFDFQPGESILTEYSHKYTVPSFAAFAARFQFSLHRYWTDPRAYFAVLHLVVTGH